MAECKFCESLADYKKIENFWDEKEDEPSKYEYTVALVIRSWKPRVRRKINAARTVDYRYRGIGYKLNFCPECGKEIGK